LARRHDVVAFGISSERNDARRQGIDSTNEVAAEDLKDDRLRLADDPEHLKGRDTASLRRSMAVLSAR
jgi:hypothetical protein